MAMPAARFGGRSADVPLAAIFLASAAVLGACLLYGFRLDFAGDLPLLLRANGARWLLAAGAGAALAVSGSIRLSLGRVHPLGELRILAFSAGAAGGGFLAVELLPGAPAWGVFLPGAAGGAALLLAALRTLERPRRFTNLGAAALLGVSIAVAAVAGTYARAREDGISALVAWLLGDVSSASVSGAALVLAAALALGVLAVRALGGSDRGRATSLAWLGLGLGVGAAGPLAFVGTFVPRAVRALVPVASPGAQAAAAAAAGAATVAAIAAVPRALVGGYTLPFNVGAGMLAIPVFLLWNRRRLRHEVGRARRALEIAELVGIAAGSLVALLLVFLLTFAVRSAT